MSEYEILAIRYAHNGPRTLGQNTIGGDPHETHSSLDFYVWVAKRSDRLFLIDTGMGEETAKRRGDKFIRAPADAIGLLGLDASKLEAAITPLATLRKTAAVRPCASSSADLLA